MIDLKVEFKIVATLGSYYQVDPGLYVWLGSIQGIQQYSLAYLIYDRARESSRLLTNIFVIAFLLFKDAQILHLQSK